MKPIFCTDVTNDKHSQAVNGDEFVSATVSEEFRREISLALKETADYMKTAQLPTPWKILRTAGLWLAIFSLLVGNTGGGYDVKALLVGLAGVAVYVGISIYEGKRKKAFAEKEGGNPMEKAVEEATARVMEELNVPADAHSVDVICFRYKEKDGKREVVPAMNFATYVNVDVFAYTDGTNLYFADMERVYAFPLAEMHTIRDVMEPIMLAQWNKKVPPADYGLAKSRRGVAIDLHHILKFTHQGEEYGIYFPCYELETIKKLTGLSEAV